MDEHTGEVWQQLLPTDPPGIWGWLESLPQPVKVTYEAGPTGYGLARFLSDRGVVCPVAAPSKLTRAAGNRVKTDAKDAEHLCRLLRLDEIVEVRLPDPEQEAARDLVRAREDVRGDLMRARHRVSSCCCGMASSIAAAKPGPQHISGGCNNNASTPRPGSWHSRTRWKRCC
jgi:transposase